MDELASLIFFFLFKLFRFILDEAALCCAAVWFGFHVSVDTQRRFVYRLRLMTHTLPFGPRPQDKFTV